MANFVFIYRGGKPGENKEEQDKIMAAWGAWFEKLGDTLVEGGNPFGAPQTVTADGVKDGADGAPATGYSVVQADDQAAAAEIAKGCPILADGGDNTVEVYEAYPM